LSGVVGEPLKMNVWYKISMFLKTDTFKVFFRNFIWGQKVII